MKQLLFILIASLGVYYVRRKWQQIYDDVWDWWHNDVLGRLTWWRMSPERKAFWNNFNPELSDDETSLIDPDDLLKWMMGDGDGLDSDSPQED